MKDIMLRIIGRQVYSGTDEEDKVEFVTEGQFATEGESVYLSYKESALSGMEGYTTRLKITGDKIALKRIGETDSDSFDNEIEFEKGKRFKGIYDTPYGSIPMEVLTNEVTNNICREEAKGTLNIDYHMSLRGLAESRSRLDIEII